MYFVDSSVTQEVLILLTSPFDHSCFMAKTEEGCIIAGLFPTTRHI